MTRLTRKWKIGSFVRVDVVEPTPHSAFPGLAYVVSGERGSFHIRAIRDMKRYDVRHREGTYTNFSLFEDGRHVLVVRIHESPVRKDHALARAAVLRDEYLRCSRELDDFIADMKE